MPKYLTREEMEQTVRKLRAERLEMDAEFHRVYGGDPTPTPSPSPRFLTTSEMEEMVRDIKAERQEQDKEFRELEAERRKLKPLRQELEKEWSQPGFFARLFGAKGSSSIPAASHEEPKAKTHSPR